MKSITFNSKKSYEIVKTDSNVCATVYVPIHRLKIKGGKNVAGTFVLEENTNNIEETPEAENV